MKAKRRFPKDVVTAIREGKILGIRAGTKPHRVIGIWAVVVENRVFVRSWSLKPAELVRMLCFDCEGEFYKRIMPFDYTQWKARVANRSDITGMVTHLTKPASDGPFVDESEINKAAIANLIKILEEERLIGSSTDSWQNSRRLFSGCSTLRLNSKCGTRIPASTGESG